jgi:hypothetical protein
MNVSNMTNSTFTAETADVVIVYEPYYLILSICISGISNDVTNSFSYGFIHYIANATSSKTVKQETCNIVLAI